MFSDRKCPKHPDQYLPCALENDPNPDPAIGGVDWATEAADVPGNPSQAASKRITYKPKELKDILKERLGRDYDT